MTLPARDKAGRFVPSQDELERRRRYVEVHDDLRQTVEDMRLTKRQRHLRDQDNHRAGKK